MKILEVCSYLYPALTYGGPAKVVYDLSLELSHTCGVTVYTTDVWDETHRIAKSRRLKNSRTFHIFYFRNLINRFAYTVRFFSGFGMVISYLRTWRDYDVVHIHDVFIIPQLWLGYIALAVGKPLIVSPHGVLDPVRMRRRSVMKKILWMMAKPVIMNARALVATSEEEARDLRALGAHTVAVIPNGIPEELTTEHKKSRHFKKYASSKLTLLYIGKLHPQKGLIELLKAYKKVVDSYQLLIAGPDDGALSELQQYVKINSLSDIHFLGFVNDADKQALYNQADLFVYPSHAEGFSISILEALNAGLPVLITTECHFPDVKTYHAGIVIPVTRLENALTNALKKIASERSMLKTLAKNTRKLIAKKYSIQQMAQSCQRLYESLV